MIRPSVFIRAESAVIAALGTWVFSYGSISWWWFVPLWLMPDLGMLGYLRSPRLGSLTYNLAHTYAAPAALAAAWLIWREPVLLSLAAVWTSHIGFDRLIGYGFKSRDEFKHTHIQMVMLAESAPAPTSPAPARGTH